MLRTILIIALLNRIIARPTIDQKIIFLPVSTFSGLPAEVKKVKAPHKIIKGKRTTPILKTALTIASISSGIVRYLIGGSSSISERAIKGIDKKAKINIAFRILDFIKYPLNIALFYQLLFFKTSPKW